MSSFVIPKTAAQSNGQLLTGAAARRIQRNKYIESVIGSDYPTHASGDAAARESDISAHSDLLRRKSDSRAEAFATKISSEEKAR